MRALVLFVLMLAMTLPDTVFAQVHPAITSFTPSSGPAGTVIAVTGSGFTGATYAKVSYVTDAGLTVTSDTQATITVPADAPLGSGTIAIANASYIGYSNGHFTVTSSSDTTPPTAPTGLTATVISATQINLSWTASTDNVGVTGYRVERCAGASCTTFAQIGTPTATTYNDTGLTASTSYSYRVRATDAAGNLSGYSSTASGTTSAGGDTTPPTAPTGLGATVASSTQINLSWTASTDNVGVTGYRVERCSGASCTTFAQIGTPTATTYNDTGLTASTSYSYRVRATDAAGNLSGYSGTASGTTQAAAQAPTAPGTLSVIPISSTQINLAWTASTDPVGVTGYLIERCTGASCSSFAQVSSVAGTMTSYSNTALASATSYSYRVRATDAAGLFSGYSPVASATAPTGSGVSGSVTYGYDALGRLEQVASPTLGSVQAISYDAAGNISATASGPITTLSIENLSVSQAAPGQQIIIDGSGFSTTLSADAVTINGVAATIVSATATQLVVTVPSGATSGLVKVTVSGVAVTGTQTLTVNPASAAPTITSFSPTIGVAGTTLTISGTNFSTVTADDKVQLNGTPARVSAATATTLTVTVPPDATSGPIQVVTPSGIGTSAADLILAPAGYSATDVIATARGAKNGGAITLNASVANKPVLALFNGTQGDQLVRVAVSGPAATFYVIDPRGAVIGTGTAPGAFDFWALDATGTYTVEIIPTATGSATVRVSTALVYAADLTFGGPNGVNPASFTSAPTQRVVLKMGGAVGQITLINAITVTYPMALTLVNSLNATVWSGTLSSTSKSVTIPALPADDSYRLIWDPGIYYSAAVQYFAKVVPPVTLSSGSTVTVSGGPNVNGTVAQVPFQGTAGQWAALTVGFPRGGALQFGVYYLSGSTWQFLSPGYYGSGSTPSNAAILLGPLPVTGTYYFTDYLFSDQYTTVSVSLENGIAMSPNGGSSTASWIYPGYLAQFHAISFSAPVLEAVRLTVTPTSCVGNWELVKSGNTIAATGVPVSGVMQLGTLAAGPYVLTLISAIESTYWPSGSSGTPPVVQQGGSDPYTTPSTQTCTLNLTSP